LKDEAAISGTGKPIHLIDYKAPVNNAGHHFRMILVETEQHVLWISYVIPDQYLTKLKPALDRHYRQAIATIRMAGS